METSSSILIILVFSSVFSQIFLSITFSSFPSLFLFPRETSHASPPPPPPLLSNPITSTSTFSLLARLLLEHREKFSSHRAYIFNYHPPPLSIIPLPSNKDPTCHVSPFLAPSDPARSVTGAVPHQLFSRSGAGEVKNGRVDLAVAKSGIGNMVTIRVYMCVCARVEGKTCRSRINMPFEPSSTHASRWMKVHQNFIDPRNRRGKKTVCSKVGITIVAGERDKERERERERGRFP